MAAPELSALDAALAPPRAHGELPARGRLRVEPEDFLVEEELGFAPAGSGAHVLLKVRKVNANTQWVARELARLAGCRPAEVGYAGLKDRRAVAVQWYSLPRPRGAIDWHALRAPDFEVLEAHAHTRKLPRGALAGNRFSIRIRVPEGDGAELAARLAPRLTAIRQRGVPNYFGTQRFGRGAGNLRTPGTSVDRLPQQARAFALSAARSLIFNALLAARVSNGTWERLQVGDLANLEGRGSVFRVATPTPSSRRAVAVSRFTRAGRCGGRGVQRAPLRCSSSKRPSPRATRRLPPRASPPAWLRSAAACVLRSMSCAARASRRQCSCIFAWRAAASRPACSPS